MPSPIETYSRRRSSSSRYALRPVVKGSASLDSTLAALPARKILAEDRDEEVVFSDVDSAEGAGELCNQFQPVGPLVQILPQLR